MWTFQGAYVDGRFTVPAPKSCDLVKRDPGNLNRTLGNWGRSDTWVSEAVSCARKAYPDWAWLAVSKRNAFLKKLRSQFKKRRAEIAEVISSEMGKPLSEALAEVETAVRKLEVTCGQASVLFSPEKSFSRATPRFHPRGVMAVISPFNFPLQLAVAQVAPALATGNAVVLKPSELTPFTGQKLAECVHAAGFPKGVFQFLPGGAETGRPLVSHPEVNGVLFVGSDAVGRKIQEEAGRDSRKICVLEMGGKNAALLFKDADLKLALEECLKAAFSTTGQRCNALSRLILHESVAEKFIHSFVEGARNFPIGYYRDSKARMGPLVSENALLKFLKYQRLAHQEGARVLLEGKKIKFSYPGYYVSPSVHRMEKWKPHSGKTGYRYDEIFGPDVAIYTFRTLEEAVQIHNDSRYGLAASVFTRRRSVFEACYRSLDVGMLHFNRATIGSSPHLPFGGIKASGNHFPAGSFSPYYCVYPVSVQE
ncbi:MAG: aldehyde dehydrogenase family protein [bacterium]